MTAVPTKRTVRIQSDPVSEHKPSSKLAEYFRSELKERTKRT